MARTFVSASSEYIQTANAVITGYPFTVNLRVVPVAVGSIYTMWSCVTAAAANNYFSIDKSGANIIRFRARDGASSSDALSTAALAAATEYVLTIVATSATDRKIYINGTSDGSSTTSRTPSGMDRTTIGRQNTSSPANSFGGEIAETTVWNAALSQAEITILAAKYSGLFVRPESIVSHLSLVNSIIDAVDSAWAWAATGTVVAPHLIVRNPSGPYTSHYASAAPPAATFQSRMMMMGMG